MSDRVKSFLERTLPCTRAVAVLREPKFVIGSRSHPRRIIQNKRIVSFLAIATLEIFRPPHRQVKVLVPPLRNTSGHYLADSTIKKLNSELPCFLICSSRRLTVSDVSDVFRRESCNNEG